AMREALLDLQRQLRRQVESADPVRPDNLHITLAFLGETDRPEAASRAMRRIKTAPFELTLRGAGRFGDLHWAGLSASSPLLNLAADLGDALRDEGFSLEKGRFKPHITLARRVRSQTPVRLTPAPVTMTVQQIALMQSTREQGKLIYRAIDTHRLTP
ncbi:MAG: RNA 2',3'-cyclic phosphodiesterase, partial [Clostridia bacterium]|nr:RNA 2',3'-cyclic phosphodiesterase [Clostridia bacterium]